MREVIEKPVEIKHTETQSAVVPQRTERPHNRLLEHGRKVEGNEKVGLSQVKKDVPEVPHVMREEEPITAQNEVHPAFAENHYYFRRKIIELQGKGFKEKFKSATGTTFEGKDRDGKTQLVAFQKGFKLREDIRVYADSERSEELLSIKAQKLRDFSSQYDVEDSVSGQKIGALKRKGWKSMLRDSWVILSPDGEEIGTIKEKSRFGSAGIKRVVNGIREAIPIVGEVTPSLYFFAPQNYTVCTTEGVEVAEIRSSRKLGLNYDLDIKQENPAIDRRLVVAGNILLGAIEGSQV